MAAVSMNLEVLKSNFIVEQEALVIYNKTKNLLDNSIDDIRNISHSMVSSTLFHSGLVFAIKEFVDKMVLPQNISITYNLENYTTTQPIEVESSLLRIIQESVNNSIKHAKASFIHIELLNNLEHQINLVIADNGIGFNKEKNQNGIGINNIEARAQSLKGKVVIESNKTMGTKLFIQIPLIQIVANG